MRIYAELLSELEHGKLEELARQVFVILRGARPSAVTRPDLIYRVFGDPGTEGLQNDVRDRKIRRAIELLRTKGVPIVASSRQAGYRLDDSLERLKAMDAELASREARIHEQRQNIGRMIYEAKRLQALDRMPNFQMYEQGKLI